MSQKCPKKSYPSSIFWNLFVVISRCHLRDNWMHLFRFYCAFYLASHLLCECSIPLLFTALIRRFFDLTAGAANAAARTGSTFLLCAWFGIPFCCHSDTSVHSMGRYRCLYRKSGYSVSMSSYVCWFLCNCNEYIRWNTKGNSCFWWLCPICLYMSYNITGRSTIQRMHKNTHMCIPNHVHCCYSCSRHEWLTKAFVVHSGSTLWNDFILFTTERTFQ